MLSLKLVTTEIFCRPEKSYMMKNSKCIHNEYDILKVPKVIMNNKAMGCKS